MNAFLDFTEPERYELFETPTWESDRREFFRIAGAGLAVALLVCRDAGAQRRGGRGGGGPREIAAWLHVGEDSKITVYTGKVEIGQNIRTSLAQAVAEELRVPFDAVRLVMADTAVTPDDGGTAGSRSTPQTASQLHRVAAAAREVLIDLAAERAKLDRGSLTVADGKVSGPGGKPSYTFGQLTEGKKLAKAVAANAPTTPPAKWTVAGRSAPKADGRAFVTGAHQYASDVRREGMLFGKVMRPPAFHAKLTAFNVNRDEVPPEVRVIRDGEFIATVAPTAHAAAKAIDAIKTKWQTVPQVSAADLFKHLKEKARAGGGGGFGGRGGRGGGNAGSVEAGLKAADKTVTATYTVAYIAHVPLEPRAAVAEWIDGKLTVWTGTQMPFRVRSELARAFNMPEDKVRVVVPDMGSGYGGKHSGEVAVEAARLAKAVGKPVKLVWTREEEFTWAYFRPAGVIDINAGAKADGALTAWEAHNYNSGGSALATPYAVPNRRTEFHATDSPLRQGSYRALASTANIFARESVMDELAHALGLDALDFRLKNLRNDRLRAVLETAAKRFGWGKEKPAAGRGFGLACGTEKGSYVASVAEVEVAKSQVRVVRVVTAFECGAVVNPDHLRNQVEGAAVMGLGGALFERIDFKDGKVLNASLTDYRVPRFRDVPILEAVLVDRKDLPSEGAGETPIVAVAPAVGNAIFAATGQRLRSLPMTPDGLGS
ncbi:MAG TPA: molybdopterin cofactor-binding domain-containing protein [Fimbriiglobus sp.]|nr:molybdopterin cofactor-binding domain-containing protein [Fimbriiglobus sp.]